MNDTVTSGGFGHQAAALVAFARLAEIQPSLPDPYLVFSGSEVTVQLVAVSEVEAWREALHVSTQEVVVKEGAARNYLEFNATVCGVAVHVYTPINLTLAQQEGAAA